MNQNRIQFFYAWFVIWPISSKRVGSTIILSDEFRSKDNINFCNDYEVIICETFSLCKYFKRRNSANGEKKMWMRENELFQARKLLRLKYIKYFKGRTENPKSTNKKEKNKAKGFFSEKMSSFSKCNSSFIIKNKYSWPIIFVTWKQVYFNPLSISGTSPSPFNLY